MSQNRKVAIITGSSQGLGASIAKKLSKTGPAHEIKTRLVSPVFSKKYIF